jgi:hypothetical protein
MEDQVPELDQRKMEDFGGRMMDVLNGGTLVNMTNLIRFLHKFSLNIKSGRTQ